MPNRPIQLEKIGKYRHMPANSDSISAISVEKAGLSPKPKRRRSSGVQIILWASPTASAMPARLAWMLAMSAGVPGRMTIRCDAAGAAFILERHLVAALQRQHRAGLVGRGNFQRQRFQNGADAADLIGVGSGQLAAVIERILQPDADIAAH